MRLLSRPSPHAVVLITFLVGYLFTISFVRQWSYRDPSSWFFKPRKAFERRYSLQREIQSEAWIDSVLDGYVKAFPGPQFCVGIPTVKGDSARYLRRTVASVLAGLSVQERKEIFLVPFFADIDPKVHEAYNQPWLNRVADYTLTYNKASPDVLLRVSELDQAKNDPDMKHVYDVSYLLTHCYNRLSPYILLLEDDVIAADGWYYRTKMACELLEDMAGLINGVYMRLFYNERMIGWNTESWSTYAFRVALLEGFVLFCLLSAIRYVPQTAYILTPLTILVIALVITPMCVMLYFAAGKLTVNPVPPGVNRMDINGCCSQAYVFHRDQIPGLLSYYGQQTSGTVHSLTEKYATEKGYTRWAMTPSVFAHVDPMSSQGGHEARWNRTAMENPWNFSFELFNPLELRNEHL